MKRLIFSVLLLLNQNLYAITLKEALTEALNNNPGIKVARSRYESSKARIPQASALDDPWVTYKYEEEMDVDSESYIFSQGIPFPTKLVLRNKVAGLEAGSIYEKYKEKEREIISKVKTTYAELFLTYRIIEIDKENRILLGQFSDSAAIRYSLGKTGQQDALRAQVEIAKIDNELIVWEQKRQAIQARFNILLNRSPDDELGEPVLEKDINTLPQVEGLYTLAKGNRPELRALKNLVDKAQSSLNLAKQEYLPDFMISYENMVDSNDYMWMVGVSVPIWFWQKQYYGVKEMKAELEMAGFDYKNMENMVLADIKDMYTMVEANRRLKELYETSFLPQAEQGLKSGLTGYESGSTDFLSLLDSQRMLLEFKIEYYKVLVNLEIAVAELERAVGMDLKEE